ncbi:hypothetical protein L6452_26065 [Arctium lappa]|uniref:Uncharacterized protein n=1 Tax=Arctium lappa TaxID=4217 RepID=A0ACB9ADR5_ARCLA|nr:hypothetical protein L6452_26065 [Arctium lappa]
MFDMHKYVYDICIGIKALSIVCILCSSSSSSRCCLFVDEAGYHIKIFASMYSGFSYDLHFTNTILACFGYSKSPARLIPCLLWNMNSKKATIDEDINMMLLNEQ